MTCTEEYKEHIKYTFKPFVKLSYAVQQAIFSQISFYAQVHEIS